MKILAKDLQVNDIISPSQLYVDSIQLCIDTINVEYHNDEGYYNNKIIINKEESLEIIRK